MYGERLKNIRKKRKMSLEVLGQKVNISASTLSRYENGLMGKWDPELINKMARTLSTSSAYLMGMTDNPNFALDANFEKLALEDNLASIVVTNNEMSPSIPCGALVKIRKIDPKEKLQLGAFYYIEFENKKCFRIAIEDHIDGEGFLPIDISERRIAYDPDHVEIIGKAVSMEVVFEDEVEYK